MAKTAVESLLDTLLYRIDTRRSAYINKISNIDNDFILIRYTNNITYSSSNNINFVSSRNKMIKSIDDIISVNNNKYEFYKSYICNKQINISSFLSAYRFVRSFGQNNFFKWMKDGYTYYISSGIILDENKNVLLSIESNKNLQYILNISTCCFDKKDYMSKYIINTFIPAFIQIEDGKCIVVKDLSEYTPMCSLKYYKNKDMNDALNEKLHFAANNVDIL